MRDTLGILLVGALAITAVIAFWDSTVHFVRLKGLQDIYARQPEINNLNAAAQSLAGEALEYSKTNPAIDPILVEFHLKARPGAVLTHEPGTNQPAKKAQ
jgi:hypothetical protein